MTYREGGANSGKNRLKSKRACIIRFPTEWETLGNFPRLPPPTDSVNPDAMAGCTFLRCRGQISGLLVLAGLAFAPVARADGLMSHSVVYDVKAAPSEK